ncbi:hypothetical protein H8959_016104 [Pygathrix nigripes]
MGPWLTVRRVEATPLQVAAATRAGKKWAGTAVEQHWSSWSWKTATRLWAPGRKRKCQEVSRVVLWRLSLASLRRPCPANAYSASTSGCAVPLVTVITVHGRGRIPTPRSKEVSEAMPVCGGGGRASGTPEGAVAR